MTRTTIIAIKAAINITNEDTRLFVRSLGLGIGLLLSDLLEDELCGLGFDEDELLDDEEESDELWGSSDEDLSDDDASEEDDSSSFFLNFMVYVSLVPAPLVTLTVTPPEETGM